MANRFRSVGLCVTNRQSGRGEHPQPTHSRAPPSPAPLMNLPLAPAASHWDFDPELLYLNHGAFGASPRVVELARAKIQRRLESQPMRFLVREMGPDLAATRTRIGELVNADQDDMVLVPNSTYAMNIVADGFPLSPGDEVLLNDHEYGAVKKIWERACKRAGAKVVVQTLPVPFTTPEALVDRLFAAVTEKTRLIVFSQITSPTAIIFPAAAICQRAREVNLPVCIDGPHAIATLPLDLDGLQCDFYAASCHKWLCAPFGSGFLHVRRDRRNWVAPPIQSWNKPFPNTEPSWRDEFEWFGTHDPSSMIAISAAIDFFQEYGFDRFRKETHEVAQYARNSISNLTGLEPLTPDSHDWYGTMACVPLPPGDCDDLQRRLRENHRLELPVIDWSGRRLIRASCPLYIGKEAIDLLVSALRTEL